MILIVLLWAAGAQAYSVLTHEEIVDLLWTDELRPLLLARYPGLTEEQLNEAHAYAYGGAVIHDLGYYPFGNRNFSNLLHYVRTGDFVLELIRQSRDADEYAFALGALSHYASDISGHPYVNEAVPIEFPKDRAKFGDYVRYAQDESAHLRTEFGFDTVQVAKRRYAPQQYHDFIGFKVSKPLLERVFPVVYGIEFKEALPHHNLAIGSFRWAVSRAIPEMTQVALVTEKHKQAQLPEKPGPARRLFLYRLSRADYEMEWGKDYQKPGFGARILALVLHMIPKVGPFKGAALKSPTPKTEQLYIQSIDITVNQYRALLEQARAGSLVLPNDDLDSGSVRTRAAEYSLADDTYAELLSKLAKRHFDETSPELRENILAFYSDLSLPIHTKKDRRRWQAVLSELDELHASAPSSTQAASVARKDVQ